MICVLALDECQVLVTLVKFLNKLPIDCAVCESQLCAFYLVLTIYLSLGYLDVLCGALCVAYCNVCFAVIVHKVIAGRGFFVCLGRCVTCFNLSVLINCEVQN